MRPTHTQEELMTGRISRTTMALAGLAAALATPARSEAQACTAGPLSAYLASAGLGCTFGGVRMNQFSSAAFAGSASNISVNPFTMQGPPGYTWVGFSIRFGSGLSFQKESPLDFAFMSNGAPLYGLLAQQNLVGAPTYASTLRGRLTGDGGTYRGFDRINASLARNLQACGKLGSNPIQCQAGTSEWSGTMLPDGDNSYNVDATSWVGQTGVPYDYTIAVLADQSTVAPEPATILLLSTGLGGVGAMVRRRKRA
jgi:hypothetical protein